MQEIAYALSTAIAVLDETKARGQVAEEDFPRVFGRISFFVNAGVRFIEEHAKLRAMGRLWEQIGRERYAVADPKYLRMRYGVQVNSLGLTESQPENNVPRIVLEALAVTLGRDARARAIQLPAWNEALGLPRPWDQQWSLRIQQILANETDLLDYPDIFEGSKVIEALADELAEGAREEMRAVEEHGGAVEAVAVHEGPPGRVPPRAGAKIEEGEITVVGQNSFTETEDSPLTAGADGGILTPDPEVERESCEALERWKAERDQAAVDKALDAWPRSPRDESANIMPATIEAAKAGATTGESQTGGDYVVAGSVAYCSAGGPTTEDEVDAVFRGDAVRRAVSKLPERQRDVISLRFGLVGDGPNSLEQVGKQLGITRERVRQIEAEALRRLSEDSSIAA